MPKPYTRCKTCGAELEQKPGPGRPRETCNQRCRQRWAYDQSVWALRWREKRAG